jgi:PAS domain S-box-containing protein
LGQKGSALVQVERKKNELKRSNLPNAEREIQHILNAFPFSVFLVDSAHKILAVNDAVVRGFGITPEQLIGAYCPAAVHGCSEPIPECPLTEAFEKGKAVEREVFDAKSARWMNSAVYPTALATRDGGPVFLHFVRDITELKNTADALARSLEHNRALCDLLQNLQYCQSSTQILEIVIDQILHLSWLGMAAIAVGFLVKEKRLEMVVRRNVTSGQLECCERLAPGECLCGKVAETGRSIVCSSTDTKHNIRYEGMGDHQHVVLPLSHEGRVLGVLNFYLNSGDKMDSFRLGFLEAAAAAAAAALAGQLAREETKRTRERCLAQVISSQEDERKNVAHDLHEQLGQSLSALLMKVQSHRSGNEPSKQDLNDCETRIRDLINQVREMARQLRPTILDDFGLEFALARHTGDLSERTSLAIDYQYVSSPGRQGRLPAPIEVCLYRVAMEALNNVILHADATRVSVIVVWQQEKVVLLVEDNGRGFDYSAIREDIERCNGLVGMEERVVLLGGVFKIESVPQKGTTVSAEIPMEIPR